VLIDSKQKQKKRKASKEKHQKKSIKEKQKRKAEQVEQCRELIYRYYIQENNEKAKQMIEDGIFQAIE
jgi:hypothetical protein